MTSEITYLTPPLPCPFCGSKPEWSFSSKGSLPAFTDGIERVWEWWAFLRCRGYCVNPHHGASGNTTYQGGNARAQQYAMVQVLKKWNRRAPVDAMLHLLHAAR
jgi:hypothetical protein